ncbi:MAG: SpoIIE family protein phosphatase [Ruminiclostridium sp.]|nr:SpoIIE family protein phosphatase [Ruminiclostridium sp.]
MKKTFKARFMLAGAIVLTVVILVAGLGFFSQSLNNIVGGNIRSYLTENAKAAAALFNTKLNDQLVMLESQVRYLKDIDVSDYKTMKETIMSTKGIGAFKNIGVANLTGATINYNGKSSGNILLTDYFKRAVSGYDAISEGTYIDEDGDEVLVLAVPIPDDGGVSGVVYGTFTKDILNSLIDTVDFTEGDASFLLDADGTILARSSGSDIIPADIRKFSEVTAFDSAEDKNSKSFTVGNNKLFAIKTPVGLHDWDYVTVMPYSAMTDITSKIGFSVVKLVLSVAAAFFILFGSIIYLSKEIRGVTAEKERMSAELNVATKIQADMMPFDFPERKELALYATMTPAKEVGGDFYDFFFIDDDHLAMVMADVAGKGMPAALFMVIAKSVIRNICMVGGSPGHILSIANNVLCENNRSNLFVTVWLGILSISSGELICANAGHEYPALKRKDGKFELLEEDNCPPLAAMEDLEFDDMVLMLNEGDALFLYTDGVPEAKNAEGERFGLEKMIDVLNDNIGNDLVTTLSVMKKEIDDFNGDKDPFDDVTMMGLKYFGGGNA